MTSTAPDRRPPLRARALLAALLALVSLASAVELHREHTLVEPSPREGGHAAALVAGCHPELATHLELPSEPRSPECPACLLRLVTRGAVVPAETAFYALLAPRERVPEQGFAARFNPVRSSLSRGPPAA